MQRGGLLRQFSASCLDLDSLYDVDEVEALEALSPRSRGKGVVALNADHIESVPMPAAPLGRGGNELRKCFSGSCLELDDLGEAPLSPLAQASSPAHFSVNNKGVFGRPAQPILEYVSQQNKHRKMLQQNSQHAIYVSGASDRGSAFLATHIIAQVCGGFFLNV